MAIAQRARLGETGTEAGRVVLMLLVMLLLLVMVLHGLKLRCLRLLFSRSCGSVGSDLRR